MAGYDKPCISCGNFIGYDSKFCPVCGRLSPFYDACPSCNAEIKRGWARCPSCGRDLNITCPHCGAATFVADKCDACHASLMIRCEYKNCMAPQFFQNNKCTACGKKIKNQTIGGNKK